jgi:hypothetical protein
MQIAENKFAESQFAIKFHAIGGQSRPYSIDNQRNAT